MKLLLSKKASFSREKCILKSKIKKIPWVKEINLLIFFSNVQQKYDPHKKYGSRVRSIEDILRLNKLGEEEECYYF